MAAGEVGEISGCSCGVDNDCVDKSANSDML